MKNALKQEKKKKLLENSLPFNYTFNVSDTIIF